MLAHALRRAIPAAALLLLTAAAPSHPVVATGENAGDENAVVIKDFKFAPMDLTVSAGSPVTWLNEDEEPHTVASDLGLFRSGALDTGDSFTFTFDKPGVYKYICSIHPRMVGTIVVK